MDCCVNVAVHFCYCWNVHKFLEKFVKKWLLKLKNPA